MAHTKSTTATDDLLDGPADHLWQENATDAACWLAIENAENLRAHGPVAGEDDTYECDDCAAVRAEVAAMGDTVNEDDVLLDEDGHVVCEACWERHASPLHLPQEGE